MTAAAIGAGTAHGAFWWAQGKYRFEFTGSGNLSSVLVAVNCHGLRERNHPGGRIPRM
jgi:hypothetical protein